MAFFHTLNQWHWLMMAAVLLIVEVSISSGFLLWIGLSAFALSLLVWIMPNLNWGVQLLLFSIIALIASFSWWAYLRRYPIKTDQPTLNRRTEQMVGREFVLFEPIINGRGKIRAGDSLWIVQGEDLPINSTVKIIKADGAILTVEAVKFKN